MRANAILVRVAVLVLSCGLCLPLLADAVTGTWTGAGANGLWTNPDNWKDGVIPGRYQGATDVEGDWNGEAVFTSVADGAQTTVDLTGLKSIARLTVTGAGAPKFTFGTSPSQVFPLEAMKTNDGNAIVVAADAGHAPQFVAQVLFGWYPVLSGDDAKKSADVTRTSLTVVKNDSADTLKFDKIGEAGWLENPAGGSAPSRELHWQGTGPIEIGGTWVAKNKYYTDNYTLYPENTAGLVFTGTTSLYGAIYASVSGAKVTVADGATLTLTKNNNSRSPQENVHPWTNLTVDGAGTLKVRRCAVTDLQNGPLDVQCKVEVFDDAKTVAGDDWILSGTGSIRLSNTANALSDILYLKGTAATMALQLPSFDVLGGVEKLVCGACGAVSFVGTEALTTDFPLEIGKVPGYESAQNQYLFQFNQDSASSLEVQSAIANTTGHAGTLVLGGAGTADATWSGVLSDVGGVTLGVTKTGTAHWILSAANTYTGATRVESGTLTFAADGSVASLEGAGGTVALPAGTTLTVAGTVSVAGGKTLAVQLAEGASLVAPTMAKKIVDGLTVNGQPAGFDGNGRLVEASYFPTDEIAAHGGVIPNGSDKLVGITTDGTTGDVTLGQTTTIIKDLYQMTEADATVAFAAGEKLSLDLMAVGKRAGDLTIGTEPGNGTLAAASGALTLQVNEPGGQLTVNAALDDGITKITKDMTGLAVFGGPFAYAGALDLLRGTVSVTNETGLDLKAKLTGDAGTSFRADGPGAYSTAVDQSAFKGDFVLNGGTVTFKSGDGNVSKWFGAATAGDLVVTNSGQINVSGKAGASDGNVTLNGKRVTVEGVGPDGNGVIYAADYLSALFSMIRLSGNAKFTYRKDTSYQGYIVMTSRNGRQGGIDMQGHRLEFGGDEGQGGGYLVFNDGTIITNAGELVIKSGYLSAYKTADLGPADAPPIVFESGATYNSYGNKPQQRKFKFVGNGAWQVQNNSDPGSTNVDNLADIAFNPPDGQTASLQINQAAKNYSSVSLSGKITGNGSVAPVSAFKGEVHYFGADNDFTGLVSYTGTTTTEFFHHPGSLPTYAQLDVNGGVAVAYAGPWSDDQLIALANQATLRNRAAIAIDTEACTDRTLTLALSDELITSGMFRLGHYGPGSLVLTGAWTKEVGLNVQHGTVKLTGEGAKKLGAVTVSEPYFARGEASKLILADCGTVTLSTNQLQVGSRAVADRTDQIAEMRVTNTKVVMPDADVNDLNFGLVSVGCGLTPGRLTVGEGADVELGLAVGQSVGGVSGGSGAVVVDGGALKLRAPVHTAGGKTTTDYPSIGYIDNAQGFLGIYGDGTVEFDTALNITYSSSSAATVFQEGGCLSSDGYLRLGYAPNGPATYYMTGGVASVASLQMPYVLWTAVNSRPVLTLDGDCTFTNRSTIFMIALGSAENATEFKGTTAIINLNNGGRLVSGELTKRNNYNIMPQAVRAYVNFAGGTFCLHSDGTVFDKDATKMDAVTVYPQGATIEVAAKKGFVDVPLAKPSGQGVKSVAWDGELAERTFAGAPTVAIYGDGYGATAVALWDRTTGKVTGIKVTSPGCDYTTAVAEIRCGNKYGTVCDWTTNACTLADNDVSTGAGFAKGGPGELVLNQPNTYCGPTEVREGALVLGCDGALPANTTIRLTGGHLATAEGVDLPALTYAFNLGETQTSDAAVTFAEGSTAVIAGLEDLDPEANAYVLANFEKGIVDPQNLVCTTALPEGWKFRVTAKKVRLVRSRGSAMIIR